MEKQEIIKLIKSEVRGYKKLQRAYIKRKSWLLAHILQVQIQTLEALLKRIT